jgi:hypothetical protein
MRKSINSPALPGELESQIGYAVREAKRDKKARVPPL